MKLEAEGALPKIEELQTHPNEDVYNKALRILEKHYELEQLF